MSVVRSLAIRNLKVFNVAFVQIYTLFCKNINCKSAVIETENMMREIFLNWPKPYPNIEDMVQAGCYYTGEEDDITCIDCGVTLNNWQGNDNLKDEHKKHYLIVY